MSGDDDATALRREIADLARQFNEKIDDITETTECTNPVNIERDRAARDFVAW